MTEQFFSALLWPYHMPFYSFDLSVKRGLQATAKGLATVYQKEVLS